MNILPILKQKKPLPQYHFSDDQTMVPLQWYETFIPLTKKIYTDEEHPFQQKLGGVKPLFFAKEGENEPQQWPHKNGQEMQFIAQFLDPRENHRTEFVRLFVVNEYEVKEERDNADLTRFDLKSISPIRILDTGTLIPKHYTKPKVIVAWYKTYELSLEELSKSLSVIFANDDQDSIDDRVMTICKHFELQDVVHFEGLKIGGIGNTCQGIVFSSDFIHNIYANEYGDSGSLHISEEGVLQGDMC